MPMSPSVSLQHPHMLAMAPLPAVYYYYRHKAEQRAQIQTKHNHSMRHSAYFQQSMIANHDAVGAQGCLEKGCQARGKQTHTTTDTPNTQLPCTLYDHSHKKYRLLLKEPLAPAQHTSWAIPQ